MVGSDKLVLDPAARTVRLLKPGMKLDAGGIAKGYAAQAALDVLKAAGIKQALVAGAGDIAVGDPPPGTPGWKVAIAPLEPGQSEPLRTLVLSNRAVSTAGDAERFVMIDGHRYSHIINPATGWAVEDRACVTVVAADGATADALETTVYILGPERGLKLVDETPRRGCDLLPFDEGRGQVVRVVAVQASAGGGVSGNPLMRIIDPSAPIAPTPPDALPYERIEIAYSDHAQGARAIESLFQVGPHLLRDREGWAVEEFTRLHPQSVTHVDAPWPRSSGWSTSRGCHRRDSK